MKLVSMPNLTTGTMMNLTSGTIKIGIALNNILSTFDLFQTFNLLPNPGSTLFFSLAAILNIISFVFGFVIEGMVSIVAMWSVLSYYDATASYYQSPDTKDKLPAFPKDNFFEKYLFPKKQDVNKAFLTRTGVFLALEVIMYSFVFLGSIV